MELQELQHHTGLSAASKVLPLFFFFLFFLSQVSDILRLASNSHIAEDDLQLLTVRLHLSSAGITSMHFLPQIL